MRGQKLKAPEEEAQIDLTPMLDVVFIMLIFFIVTASFIKEAGVEVNRPEASTADSARRPSSTTRRSSALARRSSAR